MNGDSSCNIWSPQSKQNLTHPHTIKRICNVLCEFLCVHCVFYQSAVLIIMVIHNDSIILSDAHTHTP